MRLRSLQLAGSALLIAAVAFYAGYRAAPSPPPPPVMPTVSAIVWPPPPPLEPFTLTDTHGQPFGPDQLRDHWTLLFFGYTHCPDICPTTLATLQRVYALLADVPGFRARGQVLFVSVDGERDTPEHLAEYTAYFDPAFLAASGPDRELHHLTRQFGARIVRVSGEDPDEYWFDHPAAVLMLGPDTRVTAEFTPPLDAADIAAQVREIVEYFDAVR
ncbi:MAG: SCO family protein [Gammaproteobacteria bacterium]|nr:SCO family protein [Gammaproteobacteria bacterium]MCP5201130.1 SCO family protein [Gammaproteobacteria bacterium]